MTRPTRCVVLSCLICCAALLVAAQQSTRAPARPWESARAALDPQAPDSYLLAGEDALAFAGESEVARREAVRMLALCVVLAAEQGKTEIAASACLALASADRLGIDASIATALARRLDPEAGQPAWRRTVGDTAGDPGETDTRAARALLALRAGNMAEYGPLSRDESVRARLREVPELVQVALPASVDDWLDALEDKWPCTVCRNTGIERSGGAGDRRVEVCSRCGGHPGPGARLSPRELGLVLYAESRLLRSYQRSWAVAITLDAGAPYRPPTPRSLAAALGIDPAATVYRDGNWVAP